MVIFDYNYSLDILALATVLYALASKRRSLGPQVTAVFECLRQRGTGIDPWKVV